MTHTYPRAQEVLIHERDRLIDQHAVVRSIVGDRLAQYEQETAPKLRERLAELDAAIAVLNDGYCT